MTRDAAVAARARRLDSNPPASVAQWKSSSVLRRGLGVRVPPGAHRFLRSARSSSRGWTSLGALLLAFVKAMSAEQRPSKGSVGGLKACRSSGFNRSCVIGKLSRLLPASTGAAKSSLSGPLPAQACSTISARRSDRGGDHREEEFPRAPGDRVNVSRCRVGECRALSVPGHGAPHSPAIPVMRPFVLTAHLSSR